MSEPWIRGNDRLRSVLSPENFTIVMDALDAGDAKSVLLKVSPTGIVTPKLLNGKGYIVRGGVSVTTL